MGNNRKGQFFLLFKLEDVASQTSLSICLPSYFPRKIFVSSLAKKQHLLKREILYRVSEFNHAKNPLPPHLSVQATTHQLRSVWVGKIQQQPVGRLTVCRIWGDQRQLLGFPHQHKKRRQPAKLCLVVAQLVTVRRRPPADTLPAKPEWQQPMAASPISRRGRYLGALHRHGRSRGGDHPAQQDFVEKALGPFLLKTFRPQGWGLSASYTQVRHVHNPGHDHVQKKTRSVGQLIATL